MEDRFKFRFYLNDKKEVFDVCTLELEFKMVTIILDGDYIDFCLSDGVLIKCTGLKDKNGKLIYFDDFVKDKFGRILRVVQEFQNNELVTYFKDESQTFYAGLKAGYSDSVEIIGNIYENPSLLEEVEG